MDTLKFAIIHSIDRESGQDLFDIRYRTEVLDTGNEFVVALAKQLVALVGKEGSAVTYGKFRDDRREGPFPSMVGALARDLKEADFLSMAQIAMEQLKLTADEENFATGGYVCFLTYTLDQCDYLLVAMIKERDALTLNENFEPTSVIEIDLTKLHQAARVNLDRYLSFLNRQQEPAQEIEAEDEEDLHDGARPDNTYLSFISKTSRTEVATYFIDALGCERGLSSAKATTQVIVAVTKFVKSVPETKHLATTARQAVVQYLDEKPDGSTVSLDRIARVVESAVGPDVSEHLSELRSALNSEKYRIPAEFSVHAKSLRRFAEIVAKSDNWSIRFERGALDTQNADVVYDPKDKSLKLRNLPEELIVKIEEALASRPKQPIRDE